MNNFPYNKVGKVYEITNFTCCQDFFCFVLSRESKGVEKPFVSPVEIARKVSFKGIRMPKVGIIFVISC